MRIAIVHSFYRSNSPSGENYAVLAQAELLENHGHEVRIFGVQSDSMTKLQKFKTPWNVSFFRGQSFESEVRSFNPDIIHVHNLFPNIGYHWLTKVHAPVVATFHNFRPFCANGLLMRDGEDCNDCILLGSFSSITNSCYRDSKIKTIPLIVSSRAKGKHNPLFKSASAFIVLSENSQKTYKTAISDPSTIHIIQNFATRVEVPIQLKNSDYWLYVGRLSKEKGIVELLQVWPENEILHIYGSGDLESELKEKYKSRAEIKFLGFLTEPEKIRAFASCIALVFPSTCKETSPLVMSEAFSFGKPILAFRGNVVGEIVENYGGGIAFSSFEAMPHSLKRLKLDLEMLEIEAINNFNSKFSPEIWISKTEAVYKSVRK